MKKRIVMLLSVVALLVVMLAMSVAPAFAHTVWCTGKGIESTTFPVGTNGDTDQDGYICFQPNKGTYKDDHGFPFGH